MVQHLCNIVAAGILKCQTLDGPCPRLPAMEGTKACIAALHCMSVVHHMSLCTGHVARMYDFKWSGNTVDVLPC